MALLRLTAAILALWLNGIQPVRGEALSYVAAVYEHVVILNPKPEVHLDRKAALEHMTKNLVVYEEQAAIAAKKDAKIIVFPEDGITGFIHDRASIAGYLETIPDPRNETWNPCEEPNRYPHTEVQHRLSCMARNNRLFLVANMADRQLCNKTLDPHCPSDGQYQFNTNVVYSDNGTLVARYHKQNLYYIEAAFDTPPKVELITFTTPFAGRFGVFTCFDILFREPVVSLIEEMGIRQLVFTTAWMNALPLLDAVQFQRSFSYSSNVTLLAANLRKDSYRMTGSGIYTPQQTVYYREMEEEELGKLLVSEVPVLDPSMNVTVSPFPGHSEFRQKEECDPELLPSDPVPFNGRMLHDNYTMVPLQGKDGNLTVCSGSFCCHLLFHSSGGFTGEFYTLAAFNGLHKHHGTYYLEVCALIKCPKLDKKSCGRYVLDAQSLVDFQLEGTFTTTHVYAGVLGSKMTLDLPDEVIKEKGGRVHMKKKDMTNGLVSAVLYGRVYEKDDQRV